MHRSNSHPLITTPGPARTLAVLGLAVLAILFTCSTAAAEQAPSFTEAAKLIAADGDSSDDFGYAVAIDGDTMVVGAIGDDDLGSASGSAYVFERQGFFNTWSQVAKLLADDGDSGDDFGLAVGISGDWIIVGAPENDDIASNAGAAYIFERDTGGFNNWGLVTKVLADDGQVGDRFGSSVDIDGERAIVGAPEDDDLGLASGSAYILERDVGGPSNWGVQAKLLAEDGEFLDGFGWSVGLEGQWAIVGASPADAAYIRQRDEGGVDNWGEVAKLSQAGAEGSGYAVDIFGDIAVVGAYLDNGESGSVGVFQRDKGGPDNWGIVKGLIALDGADDDRFGISVSISGDTVAVGAYLDDDDGSGSGSAYVFRRNAGGPDNWGKIAKTVANDGASFDYFGWDVAIDADTLAIGAYLDDDNGASSGSAYIFDEITVDPALVVTGNCPGEVTFNYTGATPLGQAALGYSQQQGDAPIPGGLCAGTETGLDVVNLLGIIPIDENGEITLDASLPFFVCNLQLQAVDLVSCATSNVTSLP